MVARATRLPAEALRRMPHAARHSLGAGRFAVRAARQHDRHLHERGGLDAGRACTCLEAMGRPCPEREMAQRTV